MTVPASQISVRISLGGGGMRWGEGKRKLSCSSSAPACMAIAGEHGASGPHGGRGLLECQWKILTSRFSAPKSHFCPAHELQHTHNPTQQVS